MDELFAAIAEQDTSKLRSLLAGDRSLAQTTCTYGWTALHMAARYGFLGGIRVLLDEFHVDPHVKNKDGHTPAELAVRWGWPECAAALGLENLPPVSSHPIDLRWRLQKQCTDRVNHFSGHPLNRQSELRDDTEQLLKMLSYNDDISPKFMVLKGHGVLVCDLNSDIKQIAWLTRDEANKFWGSRVLEQLVVDFKSPQSIADSTEKEQLNLIYLGIDASGTPYWAIDACSFNFDSSFDSNRVAFKDIRPVAYSLSRFDAAILAQARSIMDWNIRNVFCPSCGNKTFTGSAGYKRVCTNEACISHASVHNFSYPRTDGVIIVLIIHKDGERCLLGRQKIWPKGVYSCIAGFIECGETLEDSARREAKEETGVELGRVLYHSSQPWPFPSQLMIGMLGEAVTDDVKLVDKELEDARWFSKQEILQALKRPPGWSADQDASVGLKVPASYAIAHTLIKEWAEGQQRIFMEESKI